ncbi:MAG: hypothetical protein KKH61_09085 [Gammaproteobacteria bacterium]|uniref:hypothetical protein n=1 Tax=Stenotrophomonas TaxID=40323 RepID=UPI0011C37659|nr:MULTISPECIES: hypothetical protein [Stenotrophomonas]MBU2049114.1 hypothetical protein [Gammaproteobacteria bacterium]
MRLPLDITEGGGGMTGHRSPLLLTARITMKFTTAADAAWDCISGGTTSRRGQTARGKWATARNRRFREVRRCVPVLLLVNRDVNVKFRQGIARIRRAVSESAEIAQIFR